MGNSASQRNARSLREILVGLDRVATKEEIDTYMQSMDFLPTGEDGKFSNGQILLWDIKPKNVLITQTGEIAVIDAEITVL